MGDGTHGLALIKKAGGVTLVQDPDEAEVPSMPLNAMRQVGVDYVLPVKEMARVITGLLMNPRKGHMRKSPSGGSVQTEKPSPEQPGTDALRTGELDRPPSPFTCPDCGGSLWEIKEPGLMRYRCHVGHGFTADSLRDGMEEKLEETLWSALRAIEEGIALRKRMRARAKTQRLKAFVANLDDEMFELEQRADALRQLLLNPRNSAATATQGSRKRLKHA
jgi:two-component system chemotaxis response regulator CheB